MTLEVSVDRGADAAEEVRVADRRKQPESFEFVLHRASELGEPQLDSRLLEDVMQFLDRIRNSQRWIR